MAGPLANQRHEAFAQALAKGKTADEAYVVAGYTENRCNASRLRTNENIVSRIAELQGKAAEKAVYTIADAMGEADEIRRLALHDENPNYSAAGKMVELKAKLSGHLTDKPQHEVTITQNFAAFIDAPPRETYEEWCFRRSREIGGTGRALGATNGAAARRHPGDMG